MFSKGKRGGGVNNQGSINSIARSGNSSVLLFSNSSEAVEKTPEILR